jgi:DNA-binding PucR family transcriptional regulator
VQRVPSATGRIGLARLLSSLHPDELERFCAETLGPLAAHDLRTGASKPHGGDAAVDGVRVRSQRECETNDDLLRTLEVFAACGGVSETARQLSAHRNTVRHRIARAGALLGADLHDPEQRLCLSVALRCQRLLAMRQTAGLVQIAQVQPA